MTVNGAPGTRVMALRRDDRCVECAIALPAGTKAQWDPNRKVTTCLACTDRPCPTGTDHHRRTRLSP